MYTLEPEAGSVACKHARAAVVRHAWSGWQAWLHEHRRPKAAAARRAKQHHQAVSSIKALQASQSWLAGYAGAAGVPWHVILHHIVSHSFDDSPFPATLQKLLNNSMAICFIKCV